MYVHIYIHIYIIKNIYNIKQNQIIIEIWKCVLGKCLLRDKTKGNILEIYTHIPICFMYVCTYIHM